MISLEGWIDCWRDLGLARNQSETTLYEALCRRYSEAHRHYHTLQHLGECLQLAAEAHDLADHPAEITMALWFHDAIYEPARRDNEQQSAAWATSSLKSAGLSDESINRIEAMILATRHHQATACNDEKIMLDCDLAILGADPDRFVEYDSQIRAEYAFVPTEEFNAKRRAVLVQFLDRSTIFQNSYFIERYETQARDNLQQAIASLS